MNTNTVIRLFDDYRSADEAVKALHAYGVDSDRISVVTRDNDTIKRGSSVGTGAATGAATGGLVGLLAGLGALLVPGIGPVIATGTIASTLISALGVTAVGAGLGVAAGGLLGALVDAGFSEDDAQFYAEGVKRGGVLVSVQVDKQNEDHIRDILRTAGVVDLETRRKTWQDEGWTSFDKNGYDEETEISDEETFPR